MFLRPLLFHPHGKFMRMSVFRKQIQGFLPSYVLRGACRILTSDILTDIRLNVCGTFERQRNRYREFLSSRPLPGAHNSWGVARSEPRGRHTVHTPVSWAMTTMSQDLHWHKFGVRCQDLNTNTVIWKWGLISTQNSLPFIFWVKYVLIILKILLITESLYLLQVKLINSIESVIVI